MTMAAGAQTAQTAAGQQAPATTKAAAPLQLQTLGQPGAPKADPFPPVNQKYFTASTPTADTVNAFLKALWGYDANRIWRVEAIETTASAGVSKVIVFVSDKGPNAKVQPTAFFVMPDQKHVIAGEAVVPFGPTPFADARKELQARADGATKGAASKDLMLVEFADLQCPHCKEAQATMEKLTTDFPKARIVYQSFPIADAHPYATKAAEYGYCVQQKNNDAYFTYAQAVFDNQAALTAEAGDQTLKDAVTKAGMDPAAIGACAATPATKALVENSLKLGKDVGVDQTPILMANGHPLPLAQIPYELLKTIISYQAAADGVSTGAVATPVAPLAPVK